MEMTRKQKTAIAKIAKKHGLKLVMLFGSFASKEEREDSDMDIAVLGKKSLDLKKILSVSRDLGSILKKNVDLSAMNRANSLLLYQVERNAILLFGKEEDFLDFKLRAFHRYHDYAPYFEIESRVNRKFIKQYASR